VARCVRAHDSALDEDVDVRACAVVSAPHAFVATAFGGLNETSQDVAQPLRFVILAPCPCFLTHAKIVQVLACSYVAVCASRQDDASLLACTLRGATVDACH
jgi:hypothetical protein